MAYYCFRCDDLFTQRGHHDRHVRDEICCRPTVERRRFQCRFCVSKFTRKDNQQRHEKTCKERHRFPCSYCDATFTTEGQRQRYEGCCFQVPLEPMGEERMEDDLKNYRFFNTTQKFGKVMFMPPMEPAMDIGCLKTIESAILVWIMKP